MKMLNLQSLRLSSFRHIQPVRQCRLSTTSRIAKQPRFFKMEPADHSASPSGSSSSGISRRTISSHSPNPDFGFYTYSNARSHTSKTISHISRSSRRRGYHSGSSNYTSPGGLTVTTAFWVLFSLNTLSFGTFWYAKLTKNNRLINLHLNHTLLSLSNLEEGRYWTLLTSAFTHHDVLHFAFNMFTLRTFCQIIAFVPSVSGVHVLALALISGLAGSGGWLYQQQSRLSALLAQHRGWARSSNLPAEQVRHASAIGASGAVMGVAGVASCLLPQMPIQLMFIPIGIPLWVVTAGYAVLDSYYLDSQSSRVAHAGHLGGLVAGVAFYGVVLARKAPVGIWRTLARRFGRR